MSLECTLKVCVEYSLHLHPYSRDVVKIMCWMCVYACRALGLALADPTAEHHQLISYPLLTDWVWHMREMLLAGSFHLGFWRNLWVGWCQLFLLAGHGLNSELLSQKTLYSKKEHTMERNQPMCQWITNCTPRYSCDLGVPLSDTQGRCQTEWVGGHGGAPLAYQLLGVERVGISKLGTPSASRVSSQSVWESCQSLLVVDL